MEDEEGAAAAAAAAAAAEGRCAHGVALGLGCSAHRRVARDTLLSIHPSIQPASQPATCNTPFQPSTCQVQYDVLTRLLVPGEHYISVPLPPAAHNICTTLTDALAWAEANPRRAQARPTPPAPRPSPLAPRPQP